MHRALSPLILVVVVVSASIASDSAPTTSETPKTWSVVVSFEHEKYYWDDDVQAKVTVTNISDHDIRIQRTLPLHDIGLEVNDENGKAVASTAFAKREVAQREFVDRRWETLSSNSTVSYKISLNRCFDMTLPGKYLVRASCGWSPHGNRTNSQTVEIEIRDRE
jgi:hypothetical protein